MSRLNVLVYADTGTTSESVRHCLFSLRQLLSPRYAVLTVTGSALINEPWTASCACLAMPGGADLGYCSTLNGAGNRRIRTFVERGGAYIGFCAGGYYGSARCEFEVGNRMLEVVGDRELRFFPGICRGGAFRGFKYHSEDGARATTLQVQGGAFSGREKHVPAKFRSYYNGGGVFVDVTHHADRGVETLASYVDDLDVDGGQGKAAIIYCKVGDGGALLTGPHPEFAGANIDPSDEGPDFARLVDAIHQDDADRSRFLAACLGKLGLKVNEQSPPVPTLTPLHLYSPCASHVDELRLLLESHVETRDGVRFLRDKEDTFRLDDASSISMSTLESALPSVSGSEKSLKPHDSFTDYSKVVKRLVFHQDKPPDRAETPRFDTDLYFKHLDRYREEDAVDSEYGQPLLYGEVVTSTNSLLEKNTTLLRCLPTGFTACATVQVAGRGRGSNVWVSPAGSLMFSLVVRHPVSLMAKAPVVFLQYLMGMAAVEGVQSYAPGYERMPVRLKWPNDIYALDPSRPASEEAYVKIGGILVNSHYSASEYLCVIGLGINTTNALPTTSLNALAQALSTGSPCTKTHESIPSRHELEAFKAEKLLARLVTTFGGLYTHFCQRGFDKTLEQRYYKHWLHRGQIVTVESEGGLRARITGITRDWGLLVAEEVVDERASTYTGSSDLTSDSRWRATGKVLQLQTDSNSFDFMRRLVKRKV